MGDERQRSELPPPAETLSEEPTSEASTSEESTSQKSWTEESTFERSLSEEEEDLSNAPALSDDEIKANVVEESHRVGWPRLIPLPCCFDKSGDNTFWNSCKVPTVEGVLESLSISDYDVEVGGYTICNGRQNQASVMTLLVRVHGCTKDAGGSWSEAVVQIARLLPTMALGDEAVTAVEVCEAGWPLLAPIEYKDHVLDMWESVLAPAVLKILDQPPSILWWNISLARFASFASITPGPVTLIITASDAADERWELKFLPQIKATMKEMCCGVRDVLLWQVQKLHNPQQNLTQNLFPDSWRKEQWMLIGDGIAAKGVKNLKGTVGGVVKLQAASGEKTDYILTSLCAVGDRRLFSALVHKAPSRRQQPHCFAEQPSPFAVKVPADADTTVALRDNHAEFLQQNLEIVKKNSERLFASHADPEERAMTVLKTLQEQKVRCQQTRARVEEYRKLPAGTVKATSGFHVHSDEAGKLFQLQWALVNIDPARKYLPFVFNRDRPRQNVHLEGPFGLPPWATSNDHRFRASNRDIDAVVKLGRVTGWSTGRLNHAPVFCRYSSRVDEVDGPVYRRYEVFPLFGANGWLGKFAYAGDSGSVIKNQSDGSWIGLLVAAHPCGWALMDPIDKVLKNIEDVTGQKVVEPKPVEALDGPDAV